MAVQSSGGVLSKYLCRWRIAYSLPHIRGKILDFGCGGGGDLAPYCAEKDYLGLDIDEESLRTARILHPEYRFIRELQDGNLFDTIVMLAVIEHLSEPLTVLRDLSMRLSVTGKIVVTTPHPQFRFIHDIGATLGLFSKEARDEHKNFFCFDGLQQLASAASLNIIYYERFMCYANQLIIMERNCD